MIGIGGIAAVAGHTRYKEVLQPSLKVRNPKLPSIPHGVVVQ
jgi:hypothetical protein